MLFFMIREFGCIMAFCLLALNRCLKYLVLGILFGVDFVCCCVLRVFLVLGALAI